MNKILDDNRTKADSIFDVLTMPLQGILAPVFDAYRKRDTRTKSMTIPGWAVSDIKNTPVPFTVEHQYDFRYGGTYGPPDMPVSAGIVNQDKVIKTQHVSDGRHQFGLAQVGEEYTGFTAEPGENIEIFVHAPFYLPTDLPCSTNMLKY